ncbi:hypothetical protein DSO57_1008100 [Entomophthora muscae]|uniref:Uncharacterized protein n=1 Tax=Entomophthora muscae TaxID=34485 RepID=A0ACC2RYC6_9FUNG|nr:hypothetical protein DSO57_1008100 [Entomophthora muscae]
MGKADMLSKPRSCCCCIDLRTGCIVLAILQIIYGGILTIPMSILTQHASMYRVNIVYSIAAVAFAGFGLYGIVKRKYKEVQYLRYFMLIEIILLGIGLVIVFIAALASWDVICDSSGKRSCQIGVVIPLIASFFAAWLLKLYFYLVLNSYVDQLMKNVFVPTNMDQVVVPVTPIFEQTPHPEPFYFVTPLPQSKA